MKTRILIIATLAFIAGCGYGDRTIVDPCIESDNSHGALAITKIELTDSTTVVHFEYYLRERYGGWFRISSASTLTDNYGRVYRMVACEGITLDQELSGSPLGCTPFTLSFEPVNKGVKTVDFKEGDGDDDFRLMGIHLLKEVRQPPKAIQCIIKGEVIDRPYSHRLALMKNHDNQLTAQLI